MHGRLKVKTTTEQAEARRKELEKKTKLYLGGTSKLFSKRSNKEYDDESLKISGELLSANPDFSTLWNYRRECFLDFKEKNSEDEVQKKMEEELYFLEHCLRVNPKSYGSWHHRCWIMDNMPRPNWKHELDLCDKYLEYDERNFHCWDYRRFVVRRSNVPAENEFGFTTKKISSNFSNFSSWHYRSKLLPKLHPDPNHPIGIQEEVLLNELELVQNAFFTDPNDQSAWFYHRWLLGRGQRPQRIQTLHVSRKLNRILVVLSTAVSLGQDCQLKLKIDDVHVESQWKTPSSQLYSPMWVCYLDSVLSEGDHKVEVELGDTEDLQQGCHLKLGQNDTSWTRPHEPGTLFKCNLTAATTTILSQELESCEQLHELEPDNKWALLTIVSLMRALDPIKFEKQTLEYITKLVEVDSGRENYYHDLRSKYLMENAIERYTNSQLLDLRGKKLTTFTGVQHLALVTEMLLSNNLLTTIWGIHMCQCLCTLNLDNNDLKSCDGLDTVSTLEKLSIANNKISGLDGLKSLTSCHRLNHLTLAGNPICSTSDFEKHVTGLLPDVKITTYL